MARHTIHVATPERKRHENPRRNPYSPDCVHARGGIADRLRTDFPGPASALATPVQAAFLRLPFSGGREHRPLALNVALCPDAPYRFADNVERDVVQFLKKDTLRQAFDGVL